MNRTDRPTHVAGLPLHRWLFAVRMWLAIDLALGDAFWRQLDGVSSAGSAAAILSPWPASWTAIAPMRRC